MTREQLEILRQQQEMERQKHEAAQKEVDLVLMILYTATSCSLAPPEKLMVWTSL